MKIIIIIIKYWYIHKIDFTLHYAKLIIKICYTIAYHGADWYYENNNRNKLILCKEYQNNENKYVTCIDGSLYIKNDFIKFE